MSLQAAFESLSKAEPSERGAVFTRPQVVEQMLDLLGYTPEADVSQFRLLEPCFGAGDFLWPALERLFLSYSARGYPRSEAVERLRFAVRGVELHFNSYQQVIHRLIHSLGRFGLTKAQSYELAQIWMHHSDFLLTELEPGFTHIVGNPPYLRLERIPAVLLQEYRRRYSTFTHRADLYIPFFERSLDLLSKNGKLAYICSNRWIKNRFGTALRAKIAQGFHLETYLDLSQQAAFQTEVTAYPAITVMARGAGNKTRVGETWVENATPSAEPWLLDLGQRLPLLRRLEAQLPTLEQAGCTVGIGVATGADKVFIASQTLEVEASQKIPLLLPKDIRTGQIEWSGSVLISPYRAGRLVELSQYPKLRGYLETHRKALEGRYIARKRPEAWYRLIDPIWPHLQITPKLLIPDLAGEPIVVLDEGRFYPHHNLYWVTSGAWDLRALRTVLRSKVAQLFVEAYSVEMRGGYYRYQAQNLRKIRIPRWEAIGPALVSRLIAGDAQAVYELYRVQPEEL